MKRAKRSRPVALYIAWAIALMAALAYQFRATEERFPRWFGTHAHAGWPFLVFTDPAAPQFVIDYLQPNAIAADLKQGEILRQVNGRALTGIGVFGDAVARSQPGDILNVLVRSNRGTRKVPIPLGPGWQSPIFVPEFVGGLLVPTLCILLGFWVTAVRPRDRLAWLLLAFLLGFTSFFNPFVEFWGPLLRDLGAVYQYVLNYTWGIWLLLFGIYFPEPFPAGTRARTFWRWVMWLIAVPLAIRAAVMVIVAVGRLENYSSVFPLAHLFARLTPLFAVCSYAASIGCMACLAGKWRTATSKDARRRLSVVLTGALISFPPTLLLSFIARLRNAEVEHLFPAWLYGTCDLLYFVFPLTLTYAIVVQRAMDVRVIVRQSLQYTLARRGVIALQVVLSAILFGALAALVTSHALNYGTTLLLMGAGIWGIFLLNGVMHRLASIIDRRFFREAYQADQILGELAEKVRTIVETKPLLETVTQRISDALHVSRMAVLLNGSGPYRPACAIGVPNFSDIVFPDNTFTVQRMKKEKQPVRVYFDDPHGWPYAAEVSADEREMLLGLRAELMLPLAVKDELIGFMALGEKRSEAPYSGSDLRLLSSVATQTSLALEVSRLTATVAAETAQRERLNRELEIAREVQQRLFPQRLPGVQSLDYSAECRPAREVGGDYYDFLELPEGKFAIAIGDVSGKGIGAALMMANLEASLRGQAPVVRALPELMRRVNRMVYDASSINRYATFFYAEYEQQTRQVTYVNAGHNPPVVLRATGTDWEVHRWETGGAVIGLLPEAQYQEGSFELKAGDLVVLFTDGISESMNFQDEEWGEERLIACTKTCRDLNACAALDRMMSEAVAFAAGAPQHDDMTLVVVRVLA